MLTVCTWYWGDKYPYEYIAKLEASVRRNLKQEYRFVVCMDNPNPGFWARTVMDRMTPVRIMDPELTKVKGCVVRLRMFDPAYQVVMGVKPGERIVNLDLDLIVTGPLDPLFDRPEDFVILQNVNASNPCPYNGSIFMLRAGSHPDVWDDFSVDANSKVPYYEFPDDQGWLHHKIPGGAAWTVADGVYGFQKRGWPGGTDLPANARVVAFFGSRDPRNFVHLDWVKKHWSTS